MKCIASDMDGTLLNSVQQISEENKQAILKAQAHGVEFVVATGRSYQEATYVLMEAGLSCPVICVNGAEVRTKEGEIMSSNPLSKELARVVAAKLAENDVYYEIYTDKGAFTVDADKAVSTLVDIIVSANPDADRDEIAYAAGARLRDGLIQTIADYELIFADESLQIYKVLAFSFEASKLKAAGKALEGFTELAVSSSGHENLEITHKDAQKGLALEAFVQARGIDMADTMAIGDSFNDVSMLERAGRSIAMGNASYEIKALCDEITDTNDEHGVAAAILDVL